MQTNTNDDILALWARDVWALRVHDGDTDLGYDAWKARQYNLWLEGEFDQERALVEGWCLIGDEDEEPLRVCKDDDSMIFISDMYADEFVYKMANVGSLYHHKAIHHINRSKERLPEARTVVIVERLKYSYNMGDFRTRSAKEAAHLALLKYKDMERSELDAISECEHSEVTLRVSQFGVWDDEVFDEMDAEDFDPDEEADDDES